MNERGEPVKIEILHTRDPDASCEFGIWVDGKRIEWNDPSIELHIESVDPGAGHQMSDWREGTDWIRSHPEYTPEFRDAVVATREAYEDSEYVEGGL